MPLSTHHGYIDPQLNSRLVQAPYDIRLEIFQYLIPQGIHVFLQGDVLRFSECVGCPPVDRWDSGQERKDTGGPVTEYKMREERWKRRLMSSWGPHWMCEESMLEQEGSDGNDTSCGPVDALLRTCKQLRSDICAHLSQDTTIIVTDIATLEKLLHAPTASTGLEFSAVKRVEVVMFLPMDILTAIELRSTGWSAHSLAKDSHKELLMKQAALWLSLRSALDRLTCLSKINIWLDHNRHKYWWEFNEAAILSPFAGLASRLGVDLTAHLPSHAVDHVPVLPFKINRRRRQEFFVDSCSDCEKHSRKCSNVSRRKQFPIFDGIEELGPEQGTRQQWEDLERIIWTKGWDPAVELDDMVHVCSSCRCCRGLL